MEIRGKWKDGRKGRRRMVGEGRRAEGGRRKAKAGDGQKAKE
jgi:hypothetical protein